MQNISDLDLMATNKILIDISSYLFNVELLQLLVVLRMQGCPPCVHVSTVANAT